MAAISCLAGPGVPLRGLMPSGPVRPVRPCLVRPLGLCPAPDRLEAKIDHFEAKTEHFEPKNGPFTS